MNREIRKSVLTALIHQQITKVEAKTLIQSKGIIILDLSHRQEEDTVSAILEKLPSLESQFIRIISLGDGVKPVP